MQRRNYKVVVIGVCMGCVLIYSVLSYTRKSKRGGGDEHEGHVHVQSTHPDLLPLPLHHGQRVDHILHPGQEDESGSRNRNQNEKEMEMEREKALVVDRGTIFREDLDVSLSRKLFPGPGPVPGRGGGGRSEGLMEESLTALLYKGGGGGGEGAQNPHHVFRPQESKWSGGSGGVGGGSQSLSSQPKLKIPYKLVHIDLKGAPPKMSYLKDFLRTVRESGGNGILLEYEDMFPFRGSLSNTSHKFHYTEEEMRELLGVAKENELEVIPLVQTFGHLEFILKLDKFSHLRELSEFPQEICPSNDIAWAMVQTIIDQIMEFHAPTPYSYLHIGCDEVFHIGECSRCRGKESKDLFLNHVIRVARYVKTKYGVTPIIWDDMLRKFYVEDLLKSGIGSEVEVMMWDYTEDVDRLLSPYLWPMYTQVFPNIWVASAFKGAFGETLYKVNIQRHAINHLSWLRVLSREGGRIRNLRGIALTGWSRYDHFSVLCELLPLAVPSMILVLQLMVHQDLDLATKQLYKHLKCDGGSDGSVSKLEECGWNGVELYNTVTSLQFYQEQTQSLVDTHRKDKGWLSPYSLRHNYSSPWRLLEPIQSASQYLMSLKTYQQNIQSVLRKYFDEHVVEEWIEQKIEPLASQLETLIRDGTTLAARRTWPRRPPP